MARLSMILGISNGVGEEEEEEGMATKMRPRWRARGSRGEDHFNRV